MQRFSPNRTGQRALLPLALVLLLAGPAVGQQVPGDNDLQALRFYQQQGNEVARDAELRRLRQAFPDWTPPADIDDLLVQTTAEDEQRIYDLIAEERYEQARSAIAALTVENPSWSPPTEMLRLIELGEGQVALEEAFAAGDLDAAIRQARATPDLLRCDRINNAWRIAEGEASAGNNAAALQSYRAIINSCTDYQQIVATIEKADAVSTPGELEALVQRASTRFPARTADFDALERRLLAGRGIEVREATPRTQQVSRPEPTRAAPAEPRRRASAPKAPSRGRGSARLSIYGDLPRSGDGRVSATRAAAAKSAWGRCLEHSSNPRSLDIAYQRGWCAFNLDRPLEAMALFLAAMNGHLNAEITRDARYGLSLSLVNLDMTEEAAEVAAGGQLTHEQRRTVERIILDQRAVRAYNKGQFRRAIAFLNALDASYGLRRDLAILRAYAYLNAGERVRSFREFQRMDQELSTPETRAGLKASNPGP